MSEPTVKAMAPIRSACGPTCTRTFEKSAASAASILPRTASGNGLPPPLAIPSAPASTANAPPAACRCAGYAACQKRVAAVQRADDPQKAVSGGTAAALARNADGAIFGWTEDDHFGRPPTTEPWITFPNVALPRHARAMQDIKG